MGVGGSQKPPEDILDTCTIPQLDGCPDSSFSSDGSGTNSTTLLSLPTVAAYNLRSLFPKIEHFKTDMSERQIDVGFLSEIWEKADDKQHQQEIGEMLEMEGLQYLSTPRATRGGGAA